MKKLMLALLFGMLPIVADDAVEVAENGMEMPAFSAEQQDMFMFSKVLFDAQIKFFSKAECRETVDSALKLIDAQPEAALVKLSNAVVTFMNDELAGILNQVADEFGQDAAEFSDKFRGMVEQSLSMKIQEFVIVYTKSGFDKHGAKSRNPIRKK